MNGRRFPAEDLGRRVLRVTSVAISPLPLLAALLLAACQDNGEILSAVVVEHEITPQPPKVGVSTIALKLTDAAGNAITGARISVEVTMTHPGMPPVFTEAQEAGSGRYQSTLKFLMAGDWVVLLHITLPTGQKLERQFEVKGVQPG